MRIKPLTDDGQVIALACAALSARGGNGVRPLGVRDWQDLSERIMRSTWERPQALLGRTAEELRRELAIAPEEAERLARLLARGGQLAFELERLNSRGIWLLTRADESYPKRLKKILGRDAPPLIYGAGTQTLLNAPALAIVGSRNADEGALSFARALARRCASQGVAVVSGAARGVDLEAMGAAIQTGGPAIGVTVDPLERLVGRAALRTPIAEEALTLLTPFHPGARWHAGNAMRRNRLIYAMSGAAAVAATDLKRGGTWSGAIEDLKHGWVPLFVRAGSDEGGRALERAGAMPLSDDALDGVDVRELIYQPITRAAQQALIEEPPTGEIATTQSVLDEPAGTTPSTPPQDPEHSDAFRAVWPLLAACLQVPRSEQEVAHALQLQLGQARAWLHRAVAEQLVSVRRGRRKLYVARAEGSQLQLG